jgi:1-acyl-sn-glycerol-3-phosphate acyltransferase
MSSIKQLLLHGLSILSCIWFFSNLMLWLTVLVLITPFKMIPLPWLQTKVVIPLAHGAYRAAVRVNSFWMQRIVGIEITIEGSVNRHPNPIVVCNHQSWFDIPLVQEVIAGRGPIVQFLIKRELVWVPIIGWICLVLNFPRLNRSGAASDRAQDLAAIESAAQSLNQAPGALLVFAEGSRFSDEKSERQNSPYPHLLKPKLGGFSTMLKYARPDTPVLDLTISYATGQAQFWRCLQGGTPRIRIRVEAFLAKDISDPEAWLNNRWQAKSAWLTQDMLVNER